eukprot:Gb_06867 [translate_table: standard]
MGKRFPVMLLGCAPARVFVSSPSGLQLDLLWRYIRFGCHSLLLPSQHYVLTLSGIVACDAAFMLPLHTVFICKLQTEPVNRGADAKIVMNPSSASSSGAN